MANKKFAATYYQTPKEVFSTLGLEKLEQWQKASKNEKMLSATYYQTLKEVFWPLGLEKLEQWQNVKKMKIASFVKKC